jgi:signal transduction histidine kinase/ActR/RegA family two-component response regulator
LGQSIDRLLPDDHGEDEAQILERVRRGERVEHLEAIRVTKGGRPVVVSLTVSPVRNSSGQIVGVSKIARDITQRKRAEEEREQLLASERTAREGAERLSRIKDDFLATLSHELRTPLNAMLGWAQLLRRGHPRPDDMDEGLEVIERNARVQTQLIEDLLDMSRIISGKLRLDVQRIDLASILEAAVNTVRHAAQAKGITLQTTLTFEPVSLVGDPNRLQQVFWNLLSNSIKFTPKDGKIAVVMERVNSHVEVRVSDTGQGITPDFLPLVFERFRQADASAARKHGGLGIGLSIVKHLVEMHGGSIRAQSEGIGRGSTFTVSLPITAIVPNPTSGGTTALGAVDEPAIPECGWTMLDGVTVLVVDDEPDARELVKRVLEECNAFVKAAASAEEALHLLRSDLPKVLVSDIGMPDVDGYEFIRRVRSLPEEEGGTVPAAALTAFARSEDRRRALLAGYQSHIGKPVEPGELIAVVAALAGRTGKA